MMLVNRHKDKCDEVKNGFNASLVVSVFKACATTENGIGELSRAEQLVNKLL